MRLNNEKVIIGIALGIIGIAVFLFFYFAHPYILLSNDDWVYVSYFRRGAFPNPLSWNPTKVLPEELTAFIGTIAAFLVYPLTGDYIRSISWTCAVFLAMCVIVYSICFYLLMRRKFELAPFISLMNTFLFIIMHFVVLRGRDGGNEHLFCADSFVIFTNYVVPMIINAIIVMYLMAGNDIEELFGAKWGVPHKAILIMLIYIALFSNIYQSVILAAYIFGLLLRNYVKVIKEETIFVNFVHDNVTKIVILSAWGICLLLESVGGEPGQLTEIKDYLSTLL